MNTTTIIAFTSYLFLVVMVAVVAYRITRNLSDFVLGGRQLGGPVAALSAGASDMSAWLLLGLPGAVFVFGLNQIWLPIGLTLGAFVSWRFIAKPLRVFSELANDSLTVPAFLDNRFFDQSGIIRVSLALVTLFFFAFYTASGLVGGAMLLERFNLTFDQALLLGTTIIVAYTFVGGFLAVSWTDFFQGTLMFICLLVVPFVATHEFGGWDKMVSTIAQYGEHRLNPFTDFDGKLLLNLMAWGLGYLGTPHILVRFMAVKTTRDIPIARRICLSWMSLSMVGAVLTGFVGIAYFSEKTNIDPESIFILFSHQLFSPWLAGILFAAILSTIMCAIDSQMLASTSALTEDIYHRMFRKKASQKELIWVGRVGIIVIAAIALLMAMHPDSSVIKLVAFAWAGLSASFGPSVVGALFWRRMTRKGAICGILLGAVTVIVWKIIPIKTGIFSLYEIIPGFVLGTLGVVIGSLLDKAPDTTITEQFDKAWQLIKNTGN
ncbi:sodium/proline symporter PutP [Candidatus Berkiella aquae]|uniref:Sodium/proline symporter n=1 Tax=Candidatus Berkiella aquae TaxID=295108 RepID=A0A0Q9YYQ4_9GAMM|nr:sodium/proline symporter PutP [Candidatus Berkiella aquae]MCS5710888.1 sodium/proline symporter PutP [Candidatus Berkiella aquae]